MATDPYTILGVTKTATEAQIKSAYRALAKKHHPDLNPDKKDDTKFKEISAAYNLLSDQDKRAAFDRGDIDMDGQPRQQQFYRDHATGPQGQRYSRHSQAGFDASGYEDIFSSFFKGRGGFDPQAEPFHSHYRIEIDFLDAALGGSKRVTMPDGRTLDINIPEGIEEGKQLRLKGQGVKNAAGQGDAYVQLHIRPHPYYIRHGNDIHLEIPIGFHESILGTRIEVPTIHGPVEMAVPKGAGSGTTLRLKGKGIKGGDEMVKLKIVMPPVIDDALRQSIGEWVKTHAYNPRSFKEESR